MSFAVSPARIPADLNRLGRESGMLLATVQSLSEAAMRGPSRCPGWTRAHVVTHLARNADALVNLLGWARTGQERAAYASNEMRDRDIELGAARPADVIKADLAASIAGFAEAAQVLRGNLAAEQVAIRNGPVAARALVTVRTTEVILHHDDLDTAWTLEEADVDAQLDGLEEVVRRADMQDNPGVSILTQEKDEFTIAGGGVAVRGSRAAVLAWLARDITGGVTCAQPLPQVRVYG